jgi:CBS domain-containing protein
MTADPQTIDVEDTVDHALHLMLEGGFRHLPVMQRGQLVGIISIRDIPPEHWSNATRAKD